MKKCYGHVPDSVESGLWVPIPLHLLQAMKNMASFILFERPILLLPYLMLLSVVRVR